MAKKLSNFMGEKKKFHPEITTRYKFTSLMGKELTLLDASILEDFNGRFGRHDAALMLFNFKGQGKDGQEIDTTFTSIDSGIAIVDQIRKLIAAHYFPVVVKVGETEKPDGSGTYHSLLVPDGETPDELPDGATPAEPETPDLPF